MVLCVHALSGCDSTSALFGLGKKTVWNRLSSSADALSNMNILGSINATKEEVKCAGLKLLGLLYGGRTDVNLNHLPFDSHQYTRCSSRTFTAN